MSKHRHLPVFLRESWPHALAITLLACVLISIGASPFYGLDRSWGDSLLRQRFALGLSPKPDERILLIGLETSDIVGASSTAAEYNTYREIVDMLSDLEVKVIVFNLMMARGAESDARAVLHAIRGNRNVVLAEAVEQGRVVRSFLFESPEIPSGMINISADADGVHRRYSFGLTSGQCEPSLALAAYLRYMDVKRDDLHCTETEELAWKELAEDQSTLIERKLSSKRFLLNFRAPYKESWDRGFKYLRLRDLRTKYDAWKSSRGDPREMPKGIPDKGDIVLVGSVAMGTGDAGPTPFGKFDPFTQIHATALSDLLQGRILNEAAPVWDALLTVIGVGLIVVAGRWIGNHAFWLFVSCVLIVLVLVVDGSLLFWKGLMVAGITPVGFMALSVIGELARRTNLASFEKAQVKETLGRYFSPKVLQDVLRNPDAMQPREANITVLLTDVRNFTMMTERFGAKRVFDLLNDVFEVETRAAIDLDGSMEHFVGDQFLAYWGAPQAQADAVNRALEAAVRIIKGLDVLSEKLEPAVKELFGYGVAIHTGPGVFGNKGSQKRLDYGILGDIVNAAARIESLTKTYGVRQIITKEVLEMASPKPSCRFLDRVEVSGKTDPIEMYEVLQDTSDAKLAVVEQYERAWSFYEAGQFDAALVVLRELQKYDKPSSVIAKRCQNLLEAPVDGWHGIFKLDAK